MKMTPEQKAFFEYGKARGILKEVRFQMISMEYDEKRYHKLSKAICDAWQKRAACRAWMPKDKRHCANCKYTDCLEWDEPCCECSRCSSYKNVDRWEPMESQN